MVGFQLNAFFSWEFVSSWALKVDIVLQRARFVCFLCFFRCRRASFLSSNFKFQIAASGSRRMKLLLGWPIIPILQIHADYVTFLFEKRFLRKECKEHSIVCINTLMIINNIVLVVHWCYWLFSHGLKFYWIYCSLKWMPDHAKKYSFDVIEFTMRANKNLLWRIWISQDVNESLET